MKGSTGNLIWGISSGQMLSTLLDYFRRWSSWSKLFLVLGAKTFFWSIHGNIFVLL